MTQSKRQRKREREKDREKENERVKERDKYSFSPFTSDVSQTTCNIDICQTFKTKTKLRQQTT